jgi:predicted nucleic acid-binding protein
VVVSPLDEKVENLAVEIRRHIKLKLPDCIIAATAIALDAVLLSNDTGLLKIGWSGLVVKPV